MDSVNQVTHNGTVEGRVTALELRMALTESDVKNVKQDISTIKDDTRWIRRAVTGALITLGIGSIGTLIFWLASRAFN